MNRRNFLGSLLKGAIISSIAPSIFIPKLIEVPRWKKPFGNIIWYSEADMAVFNELPHYLVKMEITRNENYIVWQHLLAGIEWQPNMGETTRGILTKS